MFRGGLVVVLLGMFAFQARAAEPCLRVIHTLEAGSIPVRSDFAPEACGARHPASAVRYDIHVRAVRMARDFSAGEVIAPIPSSVLAGIHPGQKIFLKTQVGPVVVQREVVAVQSARPGQKVFVRAADGSVFSAPYPEDAR